MTSLTIDIISGVDVSVTCVKTSVTCSMLDESVYHNGQERSSLLISLSGLV